MESQISIFQLMGIDETPEISFEQQKKGTKCWALQIAAIYTKDNGFDRNMVGVEVRHMILERDSKIENGRKWQYAKSIDSCKGDGWWGSPEKLYAKRPTWKEIEQYVRKEHRGEPYDYEVVYVKKHADATHTIEEYFQ